MRLAARIEGIGVVGPGLAGWHAAREVLAGRAAYEAKPTAIPAPDSLPPVERRRAGKCVRITLAAGLEAAKDAGRAAGDLAAVFTASTGDGDNLHAICESLASGDKLISPTRFHNSVHNAPSGYWGIATGSVRAADSLAAFDASFGAGLLESLARVAADPSQPVLLIAHDAPYPEPLNAKRPIPDAFAVALALSSATRPGAGPTISIEPAPAKPSTLPDERLEALRDAIPSARSLPLLALLASGKGGRAVIDYLEGMALAVDVTP
jgi:hypothetical protein